MLPKNEVSKVTNCILDNFLDAENINDLKDMNLSRLLSSGVGCKYFPFGLTVDGENGILPKHPSHWLKENADNIPFAVIAGYNAHDGYTFTNEVSPKVGKNGIIFKYDAEEFSDFIALNIFNSSFGSLSQGQGLRNPETSPTASAIFNKYYPYDSIANDEFFQRDIRQNMVEMVTEEGWIYPISQDLQTIQHDNTWLYQHDITIDTRFIMLITPFWVKSKHGEHNPLMFKSGDRDVETSNLWGYYIGNFAQWQNPQIKGTTSVIEKPVAWQSYKYMHNALIFKKSGGIGKGTDSKLMNREADVNFWKSIKEYEEKHFDSDDFDDDDQNDDNQNSSPINSFSSSLIILFITYSYFFSA